MHIYKRHIALAVLTGVGGNPPLIGEQAKAYAGADFTAQGGVAPFSWTANGLTGTGLSIGLLTGHLGGTFINAGTISNIDIICTDSSPVPQVKHFPFFSIVVSAASGTIVVAPQTFKLYNLTKALAGKFTAIASRTIVAATILSGNASGYYAVDAVTGAITPTSVFVSAAFSGGQQHVLNCRFTDSDGGTADQAITIDIIAGGCSVASAAEASAADTLLGSAAAGPRVIAARPGSYGTFSTNKTRTNPVTLTKHSNQDVLPVFQQVLNSGGSKFEVDSVEMFNDTDAFVYLYVVSNPSPGAKVKNCVIHAKYHDPSVNWNATTVQANGIQVGSFLQPDFEATGNLIYDVQNGMVVRALDTLIIEDNIVHTFTVDGIDLSCGYTPFGANTFPATSLKRNIVFDIYRASPLAHGDCVQFTSTTSNAPTGLWYVEIRDNILVQTNLRVVQGLFFSNLGPAGTPQPPAPARVTGYITNNLILVRAAYGIGVTDCKDLLVNQNTVLRVDHGDPADLSFTVGIIIGDANSTGLVIRDNVAENFILNGTYTNTNNRAIGRDGVTYSYPSLFTGIAGDFSPLTYAAAKTMFTRLAGGLLDTASQGWDQSQ